MAALVEKSLLCTTPDCMKPATLSCPTCLKLGLQASRFCTQECFKAYWSIHKEKHAIAKRAIKAQLLAEQQEQFKWQNSYTFTGPLRPGDVTPKRVVPDHIVKPDYADHPQGISASEEADKRSGKQEIKLYTPEQLEGIRHACRMGREVIDAGGAAVKVGVTCDEIDRVIHEACIERNCYPSPLNYYTFPKSVCTSVNEVICHGIPDTRPLEDGDIVNIDVSVYVGGYHSDLNETFMVGNVDAESKKLVQCAYECLAAAVDMCKPGTLYKDVGTAITKRAQQSQCSVVRAYCGHGVGELFHTSPNIPHYAKNKAKGVMRPGHIFTIEPMINLGGYKDTMWPDNWTAPTLDGSRSAQFEHTMMVTETGVELLTARPGEPTDRMVWNEEAFQR
jgi:methionyl aminopeptidase